MNTSDIFEKLYFKSAHLKKRGISDLYYIIMKQMHLYSFSIDLLVSVNKNQKKRKTPESDRYTFYKYKNELQNIKVNCISIINFK